MADTVQNLSLREGLLKAPRIWLITMDILLKEKRHESIKAVVYADIALLVAGNTRTEVVSKTEHALQSVVRWAKKRGLEFSKKSIMVPLKVGLVPGFTAAFDGDRIRSMTDVKYLRILMGAGMTFKEHAVQTINKSQDLFSQLRTVRRSKWGLSSAHALLLYKAVYLPRLHTDVAYGINM